MKGVRLALAAVAAAAIAIHTLAQTTPPATNTPPVAAAANLSQ